MKKEKPKFRIAGRLIGQNYSPLVVAEIGINHNGNFDRAIQMIDDAYAAGCECVKFQSHIIENEMIPNNVIPGNAKESIWKIMKRCAFSEKQEFALKKYVESREMFYLCTPFSRAAAERLGKMKVKAYKIGSGECNNYPLVKHIASYQKPVILSTGMNDLKSIYPAVKILRLARVSFALMHCTSIYPTPYKNVRLGALKEMARHFPDAVLGLSDHSLGNYTCFAAVAYGASILEKHFTSDKHWPGPDVPISMDTSELKDLILGTRAIHAALGGSKKILKEERSTIHFAYASVVSLRDIRKGERLTKENIWVKRPGTGEIKAADFEKVLDQIAIKNIRRDSALKWGDFQ